MINQNIRIRLKSFDHKILDRSSVDIMQTAKRTGAKVIGPIPMPSRMDCSATLWLAVISTLFPAGIFFASQCENGKVELLVSQQTNL